MIDELAKAMAKAGMYDWDSFGENAREMFRRDALAVLRRLREPTPEMIAAGSDEMTNGLQTFRAMIDAAIGERK